MLSSPSFWIGLSFGLFTGLLVGICLTATYVRKGNRQIVGVISDLSSGPRVRTVHRFATVVTLNESGRCRYYMTGPIRSTFPEAEEDLERWQRAMQAKEIIA